ncbi:MAG: hypothetical protein H5U08_04875 [Thermogutta sp.]|nr:hypothetical protein [Thermogutta sp.]
MPVFAVMPPGEDRPQEAAPGSPTPLGVHIIKQMDARATANGKRFPAQGCTSGHLTTADYRVE